MVIRGAEAGECDTSKKGYVGPDLVLRGKGGLQGLGGAAEDKRKAEKPNEKKRHVRDDVEEVGDAEKDPLVCEMVVCGVLKHRGARECGGDRKHSKGSENPFACLTGKSSCKCLAVKDRLYRL